MSSKKSTKTTVNWKKILTVIGVIVILFFAWKTGILQEYLFGKGGEESHTGSLQEQSLSENSKQESKQESKKQESKQESAAVKKGQKYYSKDEVALYLHLYGELPPNYLSKNDAIKKGWNEEGGKNNNLWDVTDKGCLGGTYFGNYEGKLPKGQWYEADVDMKYPQRGTHRLVYNKQGDIYYTDDHYETFTKLY